MGGGREREGEVLFAHDHNKNLNFAGFLTVVLAQADINTPKKVSKDPTLQTHCCCLLFSHPPLQESDLEVQVNEIISQRQSNLYAVWKWMVAVLQPLLVRHQGKLPFFSMANKVGNEVDVGCSACSQW